MLFIRMVLVASLLWLQFSGLVAKPQTPPVTECKDILEPQTCETFVNRGLCQEHGGSSCRKTCKFCTSQEEDPTWCAAINAASQCKNTAISRECKKLCTARADPDFCEAIDATSQCTHPEIASECKNLCNERSDPEWCSAIDVTSQCTHVAIANECQKKCAAELCTEGQPWKNDCNDCICDNGRSICTSRVCTPSITEQSTGAPATVLPPTTALPVSPPTTTLPARPAFSGQTLYDAAERGDLDLVNKALASGTDVNWKSTGSSYTGSTALHNAIRYHHPSVVRALLAAGADKDAQTGGGNTPISLASFYGHTDLARQLIAEGAALNISDYVGSAGWYPLHYAAFGDKVAITELLLRNGADINIPNLTDGDTPLHMAAMNNYTDVAELLLRYGADAWKRNNKDQRPADIAKEKGYGDLAKTIDKFDG